MQHLLFTSQISYAPKDRCTVTIRRSWVTFWAARCTDPNCPECSNAGGFVESNSGARAARSFPLGNSSEHRNPRHGHRRADVLHHLHRHFRRRSHLGPGISLEDLIAVRCYGLGSIASVNPAALGLTPQSVNLHPVDMIQVATLSARWLYPRRTLILAVA